MSKLDEIRARVATYWADDVPVPENENPKHAMVRATISAAKTLGLTAADLDDWARLQQGEPTVGVVSAAALRELLTRLNRPGGVVRFKARLASDRKKEALRHGK